jgi:hypothetical protein
VNRRVHWVSVCATGDHHTSATLGRIDQRVAHLQDLLDRLEAARVRLEQAPDAAAAADILGELNDIAQEVSAEVERQRRELEADDDGQLGLL